MTNLTMSVTAPTFTDEQLEKERQQLSPLELQQIREDMFGSTDTTTASSVASYEPHDIHVALQAMHTALAALPVNERYHYDLACQRCPILVQNETDPTMFLIHDRLDAPKAAARLAKYWQHRYKVYNERAFLPLTITLPDEGNDDANNLVGGVLTHSESVSLLKSGSAFMLPCDRAGRSVMYTNRQEIEHLPDPGLCHIRFIFFMLSITMQSAEARNAGFVSVLDLKFGRKMNYEQKWCRFIFESVHLAFPLPLRAVHICLPAAICAAQMVVPNIKYCLGKQYRQRFTIHEGSPQEVRASMQKYNIPPTSLPTMLGGVQTLEYIDHWLVERILQSTFANNNIVGYISDDSEFDDNDDDEMDFLVDDAFEEF